MFTHLTGLTSFFPWNLIIALFLAFTFAVIGVVIFRHSIKQREEELTPKGPHPFLEKGKASISKFSFFSTTSLSRSFRNALNTMHSFIGGRQFPYQLPWILMLGTKEAGKSTFLQSLDLHKPIGRHHLSNEDGDQPLCDWWFYDHGIVLDLDGKIILNPEKVGSDEEKWKLFLHLLTHHRPKRPLDGIVLTIPASEMIGPTALSHDDLLTRAEELHEKLWNMQRITAMRVPIYLVVTKCDFLPGFESFCKSVPIHNKHDIFGWSNDQPVDSIYNPDWVDIAFSSINHSLDRAQEEIYAQGKAPEARNGIFMFPHSFNKLKPGIQTYANHLFNDSPYHESFLFRGIYFVGDSHLERGLPLANSLLNSGREAPPRRRNIYFAEDLFESKIFREVGLGRPTSRVLLKNRRALGFAKASVALAVLIGTLELLRANEKLQETKQNLFPALLQAEQTLAKIQGQREGMDSDYDALKNQADALLHRMTQMSVNPLSSIFIPPSWFSSLDKKIKYVLGLAYENVITRAKVKELEAMAHKLTTSPPPLIPMTESPLNGVHPLKIKEFYNFRDYPLAIKRLENLLVEIERKLHREPVTHSDPISVDSFQKLSKFFNSNLAGKFPFVERSNMNGPDANPEDIRTFFEMIDTQAAGIKERLKQSVGLGAPGKKALTFIEQMEKVRHFFGGYLEPNSSLPNPAFTFDVTFRVNREKECYANGILEWKFTSLDSTITMRSHSHVGYWEAGYPLQVNFQWALNSPLQPIMKVTPSTLDVQRKNALFVYNGTWALLRLLVQHHVTTSDFYNLNSENPITLRFDIPLRNVTSQEKMKCLMEPPKAITFIRLKVVPIERTPGMTQEKIRKGAPVPLPYFPVHAPSLKNIEDS